MHGDGTEKTRRTVMTASLVRTVASPECRREIMRDCTKMKNAAEMSNGDDAPSWPVAW